MNYDPSVFESQLCDDDFEEITSDEVDRVVAALERLANKSQSENIRLILENASNDIFYLVYEDETGHEDELDERLAA